jgi:CRP/FNR family transcriptional regulator, cyclic AMP receptor protein
MAGSVSADTPADTPAGEPATWRSLRALPLLAGLTDDRLRALWTDSVPRGNPAGQVLRHAGDPATHLLLLLRGRVTATAGTPAGRVVRFGEWAAPCSLDKVAVIDGGGHTATLTALTPCLVRSLSRDRFLTLVDGASPVRRHVLRVLADQARRQQELYVTAATLPTEARLAAWLLAAAATTSDGRVSLPGTQQTLADLLGVTRVTVNRALGRLRRDGVIELGRRTVTILAPELLELRAGG